jgi:hypothetical protein
MDPVIVPLDLMLLPPTSITPEVGIQVVATVGGL